MTAPSGLRDGRQQPWQTPNPSSGSVYGGQKDGRGASCITHSSNVSNQREKKNDTTLSSMAELGKQRKEEEGDCK